MGGGLKFTLTEQHWTAGGSRVLAVIGKIERERWALPLGTV